tara:strand:- start:68 stop:265 length:198 start_codon:yes stop_codon:yes gene_type:complete
MSYREKELLKSVIVYVNSLDFKTLKAYVLSDLTEKYDNADYETIDAFIALVREMKETSNEQGNSN